MATEWENGANGDKISSFEPPKQCDHKSVGILVFKDIDKQEPQLLLIKRKGFPYGYAPPAGHVDQNPTREEAARNELREEVGLEAKNLVELFRVRKNNPCRRPDGSYHTWRIYNAEAEGEVQRSLEETELTEWHSKRGIQRLALRTELYHNGKISEDEWKDNPGLEVVWYEMFQQAGILDDPAQSQRQRIPPFIYDRKPIVGRYYGKEYQKTQTVAKAFSAIGIETYPKPNAESITITSADGDTFSFLGGSQLVVPPFQTQLGFFREIQRSHDLPMANKFVYAAIQDGYLGRTTSIEVAYAMATNKRIIFSEAPTRFSDKLPPEIVSIVRDNYDRYPHLPVEEIAARLPDVLKQKIEKPQLSMEQKDEIFFTILELIRDLGKKFGREG